MEAIFRMRKRPILSRACKLQMNKQLPSSVQEVMSNDDLLIEILLRLPVTSLLVFKFVSKHWLSLITDTVFTQRRSQFKIDPPSGLFLVNNNGYDLGSLDLGVKYSLRNKLMPGSIIEQSCNGLLLCSIFPCKFYVYNPTINMLKMLPQHHSVIYDRYIGGTRLAFDPTKSPHYKVVHAGRTNHDDIQIHIYSSESCTWSDHDDRFPSSSFERFENGVYWNGSINWLNNMNGDRLMYFKLGITHHPFLTTTEDLGTMNGKYFCNCNLFESRGSLFFLGMDDYEMRNDNPPRAHVYEMRNESSGWSIRYVVEFGDDAIFPRSLLRLRYWDSTVWWIVIEEKEEDSYMVIRFDERVVKYNMASKTIRVLRYFKPYVPFSPSLQFIASYAHV